MDAYDRRWLWYLLPVFLGIIGGLLAWFALRQVMRDASPVAKNCLLIGAVSSLISVALFLYTGELSVAPEPDVPWGAGG